MHIFRRLKRDLGGILVVLGLMFLVTFLPPDTSLKEVRANNAISACIPTAYPPLVTGDPDKPGIDIEILNAVADHLEVKLLLNPIDAMGRDFNPRNWAVTRAKCQLLAGGVVDSPLTRSFLDTGPPYAETGWSVIAPKPLDKISGRRIGALTLISGLDRIGLASFLRSEGVKTVVLRSTEALVTGITEGALDGAVTEALLAGGLAKEHGWWIAPLPDELQRYNLVLGLWKGDLTLKRKIDQALHRIERDGTLDAILARYGVASMG